MTRTIFKKNNDNYLSNIIFTILFHYKDFLDVFSSPINYQYDKSEIIKYIYYQIIQNILML